MPIEVVGRIFCQWTNEREWGVAENTLASFSTTSRQQISIDRVWSDLMKIRSDAYLPLECTSFLLNRYSLEKETCSDGINRLEQKIFTDPFRFAKQMAMPMFAPLTIGFSLTNSWHVHMRTDPFCSSSIDRAEQWMPVIFVSDRFLWWWWQQVREVGEKNKSV